MSPAHVLASGTRHLCTGHQMVLFEDRIYEYSGSCSATNQISAFWITVLKNQSLWQTHLVWMSGWDLSISPWICLCYVDRHLNTSFQSGRWVWRCWAASKGIAWRKTSQELPLQDLEGKGFSTLPSLRFLFFKLEPLESLENHHKPPKFHGLWRTHHGSAAEISAIHCHSVACSSQGHAERSLRLEGSARISTHRSWSILISAKIPST